MEVYPETKQLFARVKGDDPTSPEFAAHAYRVVNGFSVFLPALNDTAVLVEMASHLAKQHAGRTGIKREHFKVSATVSHLSHFFLTISMCRTGHYLSHPAFSVSYHFFCQFVFRYDFL